MENYEAPSITTIGSLHDMTLQIPKAGGANDGVSYTIPGVGTITLGDDPNGNGFPIS
jgi:hypothetical protein